MNEGRDVWSGGNLSEKGAHVNKSLRRGLDIHKGMELFPKKVKPSEIDQTLEDLQEAQDYVEKERRLRRVGGPFADSPLVEKAGTSEGAKKGWETRRGGGEAEAAPEAGKKIDADTMSSIGLRQHGGDPKGVQTFEGRVTSGEFTDKRMALQSKLKQGGFEPGGDYPRTSAAPGKERSTSSWIHPDGRQVLITETRDKKAMDDAVAQSRGGKIPEGGTRERPFYGVPSHMEVVLVSPEARRDKDTGEDLPFVNSPLVGKEGTSEGAKRGWETRREGGAGAEGEKPTGSSKAERMGIQNPDSSGMGSHPDHDKHPLHETLANAGLEYSHSVVVNHGPGDDRVHHSYKLPGTDRRVGVHQTAKGTWMWESSKAGSGRMRTGGDAASLVSHLKRAEKGLDGDEFVRISKDQVEKILKDAGWDKLPLPDKAKEALEDLVSNGAKPVSEYTGKLMIEHGIAEEPPAFVRPKKLEVGDTVVPLDWRDVCLRGAKFDMPNVPPAAKIKKIYMGPAKVTKNAYPFGRMPSDLSKVETVTEDRMWGLDLEGDKVGKDDDTFPSTYPTRDTTMVLRMEALASPEGEVNPGLAQPR